MVKIEFPTHTVKQHKITNVNEVIENQLSFGQRSADWVARQIGSWRFIIMQSALLTLWLILNIVAFVDHWDPYPFILMNLVLSTQAAFTAPIIMMSQGRQAERDRIEAHNDYQVNLNSNEEIKLILAHLEAQNNVLLELKSRLDMQESSND